MRGGIELASAGRRARLWGITVGAGVSEAAVEKGTVDATGDGTWIGAHAKSNIAVKAAANTTPNFQPKNPSPVI